MGSFFCVYRTFFCAYGTFSSDLGCLVVILGPFLVILGPFLVILGPFLVLIPFSQPHRSYSSIYRELNPGSDPSPGFLSAFSLCIPAFPHVVCVIQMFLPGPREMDLGLGRGFVQNVPSQGDEFGFGKGFCANCTFPERENEAGWDLKILPCSCLELHSALTGFWDPGMEML